MLCIMHIMLSPRIRLICARVTCSIREFGYVRYNPKSKSVVQVSVLGWP